MSSEKPDEGRVTIGPESTEPPPPASIGHEGRTAALVNVKRMARDLEVAERSLEIANRVVTEATRRPAHAQARLREMAVEAQREMRVLLHPAASLDAGEPEPNSKLTPTTSKHLEFDAWLSFRPEFAEVLTAFRSAFGTDTSTTAGEDKGGDSRLVAPDRDPAPGKAYQPVAASPAVPAPSLVGEREPLDVRCPRGHRVTPSTLSTAEGMWYCGECDGGKSYYSRDEVAVGCVRCSVPLPPEGDCWTPDGEPVCANCATQDIPPVPVEGERPERGDDVCGRIASTISGATWDNPRFGPVNMEELVGYVLHHAEKNGWRPPCPPSDREALIELAADEIADWSCHRTLNGESAHDLAVAIVDALAGVVPSGHPDPDLNDLAELLGLSLDGDGDRLQEIAETALRAYRSGPFGLPVEPSYEARRMFGEVFAARHPGTPVHVAAEHAMQAAWRVDAQSEEEDGGDMALLEASAQRLAQFRGRMVHALDAMGASDDEMLLKVEQLREGRDEARAEVERLTGRLESLAGDFARGQAGALSAGPGGAEALTYAAKELREVVRRLAAVSGGPDPADADRKEPTDG